MPKPQPYEIATSAEFDRKYPGYFAEAVRSLPPIDAAVVPGNLRPLIAYAERWGIPDCFVRQEVCAAAPAELVAAFRRALAGTHALFEEWSYAHFFTAADAPERSMEEFRNSLPAAEEYAQSRFRYMYLAETEAFDGPGLRGFAAWYEATDPEGYAEWIQS